jgi:hypothetical protein
VQLTDAPVLFLDSRAMTVRRFPPPWSIEDNGACFIVKDHVGQELSFVYYEEEPGRRAAALD